MLSIRNIIVLVLAFAPACAAAGVYEDMMHAIKVDDNQEVASLLGRGVDVDTVSPEGESLLMLAVRE